MTATLEIEALSKRFTRPGHPPIEALRDIHLQVAANEFVSIVGASGSGKSTLLRIVDGLLPATAGTVRVDGTIVTRPGRDRAMVFQQDGLLPWCDVVQNVSYGLRLAGTPRAEAATRAQRFIDMAGLAGFERHYPHQLSGGMRQRVNVARALAVDPGLLLLDEPFAALDAQTREIMQAELLRIWQASRTTVLLITHAEPVAEVVDDAPLEIDHAAAVSLPPGFLQMARLAEDHGSWVARVLKEDAVPVRLAVYLKLTGAEDDAYPDAWCDPATGALPTMQQLAGLAAVSLPTLRKRRDAAIARLMEEPR